MMISVWGGKRIKCISGDCSKGRAAVGSRDPERGGDFYEICGEFIIAFKSNSFGKIIAATTTKDFLLPANHSSSCLVIIPYQFSVNDGITLPVHFCWKYQTNETSGFTSMTLDSGLLVAHSLAFRMSFE